MSDALSPSVTVKHHVTSPSGVATYVILLGKKRIGYVDAKGVGVAAPINWLDSRFGGVEMDTSEREAVLVRIRELMAVINQSRDDEAARIKALEAGVPPVDLVEADETPQSIPERTRVEDEQPDAGGDEVPTVGVGGADGGEGADARVGE